jgi:hypothetical protein
MLMYALMMSRTGLGTLCQRSVWHSPVQWLYVYVYENGISNRLTSATSAHAHTADDALLKT